jgi:hypothetical protein
MKFLGGGIKGIDYSSVNYSFYINGNDSFRAKFGSLVYFCYLIFFMYFAIHISLDFVFKQIIKNYFQQLRNSH